MPYSLRHVILMTFSWPLHKVHQPGFMRKEPEHKFLDAKSLGFIAHDDEIHINTQSGSQWDGFSKISSKAHVFVLMLQNIGDTRKPSYITMV